MVKDNGGPAFPEVETDICHQGGVQYDRTYSFGGMSLRDYFAAKAMAVCLQRESFSQGESSLHIDAARCYRFADAMLAERAKS